MAQLAAKPFVRSNHELAALLRATKFRTLRDMPEREIKALEAFYGCKIARPRRSKR